MEKPLELTELPSPELPPALPKTGRNPKGKELEVWKSLENLPAKSLSMLIEIFIGRELYTSYVHVPRDVS